MQRLRLRRTIEGHVLPVLQELQGLYLRDRLGATPRLVGKSFAEIEKDDSPSLSATAAALRAAGVGESTVRDRVLVREACVNISTRAAKLSATAVAALLAQMRKEEGCTVAVDGTVFECYPFFKERMEGGLVSLLGERKAAGIKLVLAKDGSGVGAAIIAAIA